MKQHKSLNIDDFKGSFSFVALKAVMWCKTWFHWTDPGDHMWKKCLQLEGSVPQVQPLGCVRVWADLPPAGMWAIPEASASTFPAARVTHRLTDASWGWKKEKKKQIWVFLVLKSDGFIRAF